MSELVLTLRAELPQRLDASALVPEFLARLSTEEISRVQLRFESGESVAVGELFSVDGTPSERVRCVGDFSRADGIGTGMSTGAVRIEGDTGHRTGSRMTGGSIEVTGSVGDDTGLEMSDGRIVIRGSAGRRTGSAMPGAKRGMSGGEIIIFGDAGRETGTCMRRGIIAVGGWVGPAAAQAAIAGTIVALGDVEAPAGRWSKRSSLIGLSNLPILPTYSYACTYRPSYVRLLLTYLRRTYGFPVTPEQAGGLFQRYSGDMAESMRGEILRWVGE